LEILDGAFERLSEAVFLGLLSRRRPEIVGITAMTHEIPRVRKICAAIKANTPTVSTILGGPHATARPRETLEEITHLDFALAGEGEQPFMALLERLDGGARQFDGIEGLAFRENAHVVYNGPQTTFFDLEKAPPPAVDLYYHKNWFRDHPNSEYRLLASRGCPMQCAYCSRVLGEKIRWRKPEAVVEEWTRAVRYYGARTVFIHDDIFLYNHTNTHEILDNILDAGIHREAQFNAMTHVKWVDRGVLEKAAKANCFKICIGVESGNDAILARSCRNYKLSDAFEAVRDIKRAGVRPFTFFILGHPGETHRTIMDTIKAAVMLNPYEIGMGVMVPYPGTEIYELARRNEGGYRLTDADWDAYDRYGGKAMEFDRFSRRQLIAYQVLGYTAFFLLNFKLRGMVRYFVPKFRGAFRVVTGRGL
jgi:radical SAM superfamily enzyme YgiQ (UPF0313 family)